MKRKNLWVCETCLKAIESHEGHQGTLKHDIDDEEYYTNKEEYNKESKCDWCEDTGFCTLYELI